MDGMLHLATGAVSQPAKAGLLGILYAEDFDDPQPAAPALATPDLEPEPVPTLTQADVDAASTHAVAVGRLEWEASAAQKRLDLLGAVRSSLAEIRAEAEAVALAAAEATVATILSALMGALPRFCAQHGPNEVRGLLDRLLPMLRAEPKITIRVHPDLVSVLREELADLQLELAGVVTVTAAPVAPGDLKVSWENGSFVRDTAAIQQAMHETLRQLGLVETSPKRSLAYAE